MATDCLMCGKEFNGAGSSAKVADVLLFPLCPDCHQQCYDDPHSVVTKYPRLFNRGGGNENKGFLGSVFDLSFTEFVTTRIIKFLFILGIIFAALGILGLIIAGFSKGIGEGILFLVLSPLVFLIYVFLARIWCEMLIVVFRIAENTGRLVDQGRHSTP